MSALTARDENHLIAMYNNIVRDGWSVIHDGCGFLSYPPKQIRDDLGLSEAFKLRGVSIEELHGMVVGFKEALWIIQVSPKLTLKKKETK